MISVTWSMERKPFCAFVERIIISVWLTVCLREFCSYMQTESYLITWNFRGGALKHHQDRSNPWSRKDFVGRWRTSFAQFLWELLPRELCSGWAGGTGTRPGIGNADSDLLQLSVEDSPGFLRLGVCWLGHQELGNVFSGLTGLTWDMEMSALRFGNSSALFIRGKPS